MSYSITRYSSVRRGKKNRRVPQQDDRSINWRYEQKNGKHQTLKGSKFAHMHSWPTFGPFAKFKIHLS